MTRTLTIISRDSNSKVLNTTVSNVNPSASAADLLQFAQTYNGLTTNTYVDALCTEKSNLSELVV